MKIQQRILVLGATSLVGLFVTQAQAQYRPVGDDGIAASPKLRQMLNEHGWSASPRFTVATVSSGKSSACKATKTFTKMCGQCCQAMAKESQPKPAK
jgi:hypothetical protein